VPPYDRTYTRGMTIDRVRRGLWIVGLAAACGGEIGDSVSDGSPTGGGGGGPGGEAGMEEQPTGSGGASEKSVMVCESFCALRAECSDISADLCEADCLVPLDEDNPGECLDARVALYACLGAQDGCAAFESGEGCVAQADDEQVACS
jgi:hypothetical protein